MKKTRTPVRGDNHDHSHSFRSPALLALIFAAAAVLPMSLRAQQAPVADTGAAAAETLMPAATVTSMPLTGPRVQSVRFAGAEPSVINVPRDNFHTGPNVAMMAVGGAALIVGLLIGGDSGVVIASAGGAVGLVGLYRYLR